jgi:hypothetical protein
LPILGLTVGLVPGFGVVVGDIVGVPTIAFHTPVTILKIYPGGMTPIPAPKPTVENMGGGVVVFVGVSVFVGVKLFVVPPTLLPTPPIGLFVGVAESFSQAVLNPPMR